VNPIEFIVKLLLTAWPFVKEMVLQGHSLKHALVFDRKRAIFGIIIMASFFFNIVNLGMDTRMVRILMSYSTLQKEDKALKDSYAKLKSQVSNGCQVTVPQTVPTPVAEPQVSNAGYNLLRDSFTQLNAQH